MKVYSYRRRKKKYNKIGLRLIAVALVLIGTVILSEVRVRPIIIANSENQGRVIAEKMINRAVLKELEDGESEYSQLVKLDTDDYGSVISIESNTVNINKLKARLSDSINNALADLPQQNLYISLGTITGVPVFYGQGPHIGIRLEPMGNVETQLVSKFSSAGINQTLHQIVLNVTVQVRAIVPAFETNVKVSTNFILAETVVIGKIPDNYTHIISDDSDLINKISDYKATGD